MGLLKVLSVQMLCEETCSFLYFSSSSLNACWFFSFIFLIVDEIKLQSFYYCDNKNDNFLKPTNKTTCYGCGYPALYAFASRNYHDLNKTQQSSRQINAVLEILGKLFSGVVA